MITFFLSFLAATLGEKQFWSGALPFCDKGTTPRSFLFEIIDVLYMICLEFLFMFYTCFSLKSLRFIHVFLGDVYICFSLNFLCFMHISLWSSLIFFNILNIKIRISKRNMFLFEILIFMFNMFMSMHTILAFHAVPVHSRFVPLQLLILFSTDTQRQ